MKQAVIVGAARTAIGNFGGALAGVSAVDLGRTAAEEAIKRAGIGKADIDEVIVGNVLSAGLGQNVARQIAVGAGIPVTVPAMTLNKVCGSGLRAVTLAAQIIRAGDAQVILAGGTESMSNAPYLLNKARFGYRLGNDSLVDSIISDGLTDVFNDYHMGLTAENIAERWKISREEQDAFACESQNRAEAAIRSGRLKDEIAPVTIPQRKGDPAVFDTDEFPRFGTTVEALARLKPAFKKDGSVTAGNASGINDGAAMLIVMSEEKAGEMGLQPLARIVTYDAAGLEPDIMGYGPVPASKGVFRKTGLKVEDIDLFEFNEAFAAQSLAVLKDLQTDPARTNVNGGAIALGHPIGASGARITVTLLYEMAKRKSRYGLAALCIGGGMGTALLVERL